MDTDKARQKLQEVKDRYNLGGDIEKEKEKMGIYTPKHTPGVSTPRHKHWEFVLWEKSHFI